jgi:hypothetical protein
MPPRFGALRLHSVTQAGSYMYLLVVRATDNHFVLHWFCVENSSKRALKSGTRTPGSEDKKTPGGLRLEGGIGQSRRRRTKPLGLRQVNPDKSGVN